MMGFSDNVTLFFLIELSRDYPEEMTYQLFRLVILKDDETT